MTKNTASGHRRPGAPAGPRHAEASARTMYYRAKARGQEMQNQLRAGELVEASEAQRVIESLVLAARERLLSLPVICRQRGLVTAAGEEALRLLVEQALAELATR